MNKQNKLDGFQYVKRSATDEISLYIKFKNNSYVRHRNLIRRIKKLRNKRPSVKIGMTGAMLVLFCFVRKLSL